MATTIKIQTVETTCHLGGKSVKVSITHNGVLATRQYLGINPGYGLPWSQFTLSETFEYIAKEFKESSGEMTITIES
jgi:hypothetical protein